LASIRPLLVVPRYLMHSTQLARPSGKSTKPSCRVMPGTGSRRWHAKHAFEVAWCDGQYFWS